jgi:hypothetical protein
MSAGSVDAGRTPPGVRSGFGRYLQAARIDRNIPLEAVAEETRILLSTLQAIESEALDRLPPDVFLKGFLRAFARAVGADEGQALALYLDRRRDREDREPAEAIPSPPAVRCGSVWKLALLLTALAGVVALSTLAYQLWGPGHPVEAPAPPPAAAPAAATPHPPSESVKRPHIPTAPVHVLVISAHDESWVKVSIDQGTPSEHRLKPGGQLRLEASTGFNLLVGNAAGVKVTLDNRPIQVPGRRGEAVNLQLP